MAGPRHALTLRSRGQRSRSQDYEVCCRRDGCACRHDCSGFHSHADTHTHTHITHTHTTVSRPSWILSGTTRVSRYQKGKTRKVKLTGARDREWQWHQLGYMQICTLTQTPNHANIPPLSFLQARCPSCRPTNSVKALKALRCLSLPVEPGGWTQCGTVTCSV